MSDVVQVKVVTDLSHDMPQDIKKGMSELPNKFFVDYVDKLRAEKPEFADLAQKDPNQAILYNTYQEFLDKKTGRAIDMTLSAAQNGITSDGMTLCFILSNQAG